jgi:hypothetical protein
MSNDDRELQRLLDVALERERLLLLDLATFCEARADLANTSANISAVSSGAAGAYRVVRDHCLELAMNRS